MAGDFGVVYPLWDFAADEGSLLEQVAGDVGIDHLTVPVVTGAQTQFRFVSGGGSPHFHTEGGWHYRPQARAYAAVLKPPKARWFAGGDLLAQMRERAAAFDVRLLLRVDVRAVRALVEKEPHLCQRNAWGQEVPSAGGCACNPDLRELLRATFDDLARYEPAGYELVDGVPDCAADRGVTRPFGWHPAIRHLLDICFCASCRQVAEREGVDPDQAARSVRVRIERHLAGQTPISGPDDTDPVVSKYVATRAKDCCLWLQRLAESDPERRRLLVRTFGEWTLGNCAPWVRMVRFPAGACGPLDGEQWAERVQALPEISALALPVWRPTFNEAAELVRLVSEAVRAGVSTFDFEGLCEAPWDAITWLKQAIRFARRG
ncbi:MAG: hypothetical protein KAY37_01215 [Phycisphaerae bacterium]|nr:hypothetical protein [Phycisphaerae bacterium]